MNIISFFNFNNQKYIILKEKSSLLYCIKENKNFRFAISKDEENIFSYILNSITPSLEKNFVIKTLSYNNISYKLFFDSQKDLYYTDTVDNKIVSYINFRYNHMSDFCYNDQNMKDGINSSYFQRFIKIGKKIVCVFALSTLSLSFLSNCCISSNKNCFNIVNESTSQTYNFSMLQNSLESNPYLENTEKDFIKNLQFVFDENHEYMDIDMIIDRFSNLKINYISDSKETIAGSYNFKKNEINLYNCNNFENCDITSFLHEFLHVLQQPSNNILAELSNEFFSREIIRRLYDNGIISKDKLKNTPVLVFGKGYDDYMPTYYVLANLLDEKTLRKFQFDCNPYTLIEGLSRSEDKQFDTKKAEKFVIDINSLRTYNTESNTYKYVTSFDKFSILSDCYEHLNYYCKLKNGYEIKDNLQIAINYLHTPSFSLASPFVFNPYTSEEIDLLESMILGDSYDSKNENSFFPKTRYVIPKDYLGNNHKNPLFSFFSDNLVTTSITEDFAKRFYDESKNIKKNISTPEKSQ